MESCRTDGQGRSAVFLGRQETCWVGKLSKSQSAGAAAKAST